MSSLKELRWAEATPHRWPKRDDVSPRPCCNARAACSPASPPAWRALRPNLAREPRFEFHAEAGAPEGALYVDGRLVGWLSGVRRL